MAERAIGRGGHGAVLLHHFFVFEIAARGENDVLGVDGDLVARLVVGNDASGAPVLHDELFGGRFRHERAALFLKELRHCSDHRGAVLARIDVPGEILGFALFRPHRGHFFKDDAALLQPVDRELRFGNKAANHRRIGLPMVIVHHFIERFFFRELHAGFLLDGAPHSVRAFHIVAVAANDRVLFKQNGLESAFDSAGRSDRAACACAHDDEVCIGHLVGSEDRLHAEAGAYERTVEHLDFIRFSFL